MFELIKENESLKKKERKVTNRQVFFDKYCLNAENKILNFSKIFKDYYKDKETIKTLNETLKEINLEKQNLESKSFDLKEKTKDLEFKLQKRDLYLEKIKPILKFKWEDIIEANKKNVVNLNIENINKDFDSKVIFNLLNTLKDFLKAIEGLNFNSNNKVNNFSQILSIIDNVAEYFKSLIIKINNLKLNQSKIIDIIININKQFKESFENNKKEFNYVQILQFLRVIVSKLLLDSDLNEKIIL